MKLKAIITLVIILFSAVGCSGGMPEHQAQQLFDHSQRSEAELLRLEQEAQIEAAAEFAASEAAEVQQLPPAEWGSVGPEVQEENEAAHAATVRAFMIGSALVSGMIIFLANQIRLLKKQLEAMERR